MALLSTNVTNLLKITRLSGQCPRFSQAIATRRIYETAYSKFPRQAAAILPNHPIEIVVAVSSVCQLSCSICGISKIMKRPEYKGKKLSFTDLEPAFHEVAQWKPRPYFKFTGGEPLLIGDELIRMLEECRRMNIPTRVSTNGILLSDKEKAEAVVACRPDAITISIDGPKGVHDRIRGRDYAFDRAVQGIRNLGRAKSSRNTDTPLIQVSSVIHTDNFHVIKEIESLCMSLPIQWWNIQLLNFVSPEACDDAADLALQWNYPPGPWSAFVNEESQRIDPGAVASAVSSIKKRKHPFAVSFLDIGEYSESNLREYYSGSRTPLFKKLCAIPFISMHIVPNGDMVFCIDYPHVIYGNIRTHPLKAAWNSEEALRYRENILSNFEKDGGNPPQCHRCNWMFN